MMDDFLNGQLHFRLIHENIASFFLVKSKKTFRRRNVQFWL